MKNNLTLSYESPLGAHQLTTLCHKIVMPRVYKSMELPIYSQNTHDDKLLSSCVCFLLFSHLLTSYHTIITSHGYRNL